jgi:hypothetical protein
MINNTDNVYIVTGQRNKYYFIILLIFLLILLVIYILSDVDIWRRRVTKVKPLKYSLKITDPPQNTWENSKTKPKLEQFDLIIK